jgi:hypothetical protein
MLRRMRQETGHPTTGTSMTCLHLLRGVLRGFTTSIQIMPFLWPLPNGNPAGILPTVVCPSLARAGGCPRIRRGRNSRKRAQTPAEQGFPISIERFRPVCYNPSEFGRCGFPVRGPGDGRVGRGGRSGRGGRDVSRPFSGRRFGVRESDPRDNPVGRLTAKRVRWGLVPRECAIMQVISPSRRVPGMRGVNLRYS